MKCCSCILPSGPRTVLAAFHAVGEGLPTAMQLAAWVKDRLFNMDTEAALRAEVARLERQYSELENEAEDLREFQDQYMGKKLDGEFGRGRLEGEGG